ncbi:MAG: glycosyltransferase [bacterium]|nr:glycosyltransferase [bacterium]
MSNPRRKAVIIYPHIGEYGGIERNIIALAQVSSSRGVEPYVLCAYDRVGLNSDFLTTVEFGDNWNPFVKARRIRRWLQKHRSELVGQPLFFGCKAGTYAAMAGERGYVLHYTDPPSLLSRLPSSPRQPLRILRALISSRYRRAGVRNARLRLTMTERNARELGTLFRTDFRVIYQGGVRPTKTYAIREQNHQTDVMCWFSICRLAASKNLAWITAAAKEFIREHPDGIDGFQVVIAGDGPEREHLEEEVRAYGMDRHFRFTGFLDSNQVEEEFKRADLFLVPGRQGYGLPVLEALYRRIPVVLNRESRVSEILDNNPWVRVTENSKESFVDGTLDYAASLREGGCPPVDAISQLPTEEEWAKEIGSCCQWW